MDIIDLIHLFDLNDYEISLSPNKTRFSFKSFARLCDKNIHEHLIKFCEDKLISISGTYKDGIEFDGEYNKEKEIESFDVFFNHKTIEEYILRILELSDEKANSIFILSKSDFENFDVNILVNNKINIIIYPFLEKNISNGYVYFLNSLSYSVQENNVISKKLKDIKQLSTILLSNYYLPDFFFFPKEYFDILPQNFSNALLSYFLISLASSSNNQGNTYSILFKGFKTIDLILTENKLAEKLKGIESDELMKIYNWVFDELKSADVRLNILRNLLTLDGNDQESIFGKLSFPKKLLKSCEHQYELLIQGSIKEHFDTLDKTFSKVKEYVSGIESQINKLTNTINNTVIGLFGFAITFLLKITQNAFFPWFLFSILLLFYLAYLIFLHLPSIKKSKSNLVDQFYVFLDLVSDKLKAIEKELVDQEFKQTIKRTEKQFNNYYNVIRISLIILFIILMCGSTALILSWYNIPVIII